MANVEVTLDILNDLLRIHYERIEAYRLMLQECRVLDNALDNLLSTIVAQAETFKTQLAEQKQVLGLEPDSELDNIGGEVYSAWADLDITFQPGKLESMLQVSRKMEEALQRAYDTAILTYQQLRPDLHRLILQQQQELKGTAHQLREYIMTSKAFKDNI